jgi:integrase
MRKPTGQIIERKRGRDTAFAVRFRAYGERHYLTLGYKSEGWTHRKAEEHLADLLADVRRGIWQPPETETAETEKAEPTLHEFASDWYARQEAKGLRERSLEYIRWALTDHVLPVLGDMKLSAITVETIDAYASRKASEGKLSNGSINKTLEVLSSCLELAVEYGHLTANPAKGKRRRLKAETPARSFLEPEQVGRLLEAAAELDGRDRQRRRFRRPLLAVLAFAGLRVGEALALRWRDVDLAGGVVHVRESKTDAGIRDVEIQPELHDELVTFKAGAAATRPGDLVFGRSTGKPEERNNVRQRVLLRAVELANDRITEEGGGELLPDSLSPHSLRRTFASWLIAEGEDVAYVMAQLGHRSPDMTLGLYAKALRSKRRRPHARRTSPTPDWAPERALAAIEQEAAEAA